MIDKPDRPNFLIFVTDQMQAATLGCNGHPMVRTPHLDALAADGVTFRRAYCNNPVCMPSRATMITGLTPRQHGCLTNGISLPESAPTITQALTDAGYRTHSVGKLHLQPWGFQATPETLAADPPFSQESRPHWMSGRLTSLPRPYYGFQTAELVGGHVADCFGDYYTWLRQTDPTAYELYSRARGTHATPPGSSAWRMALPRELHYNEWIANRSIDFLNASSPNQPFFLWCSFPDPHFPFSACQPYSEMYDPATVPLSPTWQDQADPCAFLARHRAALPDYRRQFAEPTFREITAQTFGMITHIDDCIGRVLNAIRTRGAYENTVVVMMSDHGEYLGAHHLLYKGAWPWEELWNVPFIWKGMAGSRARGQCRDVVSLLDFAPTILHYAGIDENDLAPDRKVPTPPYELPGRSLRHHLQDNASLSDQSALVEYDGDGFRMRGIVLDQQKLVFYSPSEDGALYDLKTDPTETRNLWNDPAHARIKADLFHELLARSTMTDRLDTTRLCGC